MLHCFLGVGAQGSSPFPFPSFASLKLNPPLTPPHLSLFYHSPPSYFTSIAGAASATATPLNPQNKDLLVDFLVNFLEFKRHEAISVSMQVNPLKSSGNPILVVNLLLNYGLTKIQIQNIVSSFPKILKHRADRTLEPKLKYFLQELGFSGSDFVIFIKKNPIILSRGLDTCIIPTVNYLKEELGGDENVVQTIRDTLPWLMSSPTALKRLQLNVTTLRNYGIGNEVIRKFIIQYPKKLLQKPETFKDALSRVERELGIRRDSPMFFRGVCALASVSKATLQMRVKVFKSFGWTDLDITNMSRSQPFCLSMSEDRIRRALTFLMKELGYTSEYLASHACFLMYSMENRVKPRYEVLKILKEKKLVDDKPGLYSLVIASESTFLQKHVLCYLDEVPNLYEIYKNRIED